jgi:hypothetical protein
MVRYGLKAGVELTVLGNGFDIESGIFLDAPGYQTCLTYQPDTPCELGLTENFFSDIGAYAKIVEKVNFLSFEAGPTAATTFLATGLPSICLASSFTQTLSPTPPGLTTTPLYGNNATIAYTSPATAVTASSLLGTEMTTSTVGTPSIYTIKTCASSVGWCPSRLASELTLTKTVFRYTTVCPVSQTVLPSAKAPASASASTTSAPTDPMAIIATPITLTTLQTPVTSLIENITGAVTIATLGTSILVTSPAAQISQFPLPKNSTNTSTSMTANGIAAAINSQGGFATFSGNSVSSLRIPTSSTAMSTTLLQVQGSRAAAGPSIPCNSALFIWSIAVFGLLSITF